ncbi:MAG: fumarate reductase subunit D [Candidatus Rokuibacteriota bacterium]|nr:MAG: fumarate reductase subunit D [Candidatus Rokubacteria bacterium]
MLTRKTSEPFWWLLFAAGGMVAALLVPVHLLVQGLAVPLGWTSISHARMLALAAQPLVKLYLFALIALPLYHWAHRFRFILEDLGLRGLRTPIALLSYGAAVLGTVATLWVLWRI